MFACSPLKLLNRHNEVWYVARGGPVCTDPQEPTPARTPRHVATDSPADAVSDSPSPCNLSAAASRGPPDVPALPTSRAAPGEAALGRPTASAHILPEPATNSSDPVSVSPSLEAGSWNSTAPVVEPGLAP